MGCSQSGADRPKQLDDQVLKEYQAENKHHRRDIHAPQIRHDPSDWPKGGFGQPVENIDHCVNEAILRVYDIESDQPAKDGAGDDHVNVEIDDLVNQD